MRHERTGSECHTALPRSPAGEIGEHRTVVYPEMSALRGTAMHRAKLGSYGWREVTTNRRKSEERFFSPSWPLSDFPVRSTSLGWKKTQFHPP